MSDGLTTPRLRRTPPTEGNVPQLRFPEFKDAGAWEVAELKDIACFVSDKVSLSSVSLANYVSTENIQPDYEGIVIASKLPTTGSVTQYVRNDILISNIRPYLKKVWFSNQEGGASNDVIVVRAKCSVLPSYLSFILRNDAFIDYVMTGAKGVKMPRGDTALMKAYGIAYPQKQEQQKVAACLSSLDDLITAENQQLEALKTHKKGLMQQLFPNSPPLEGWQAQPDGVVSNLVQEHDGVVGDGLTTPRLRRTPPTEGNVPQLRFPEFKDTGEWEEKTLGSVFKTFSGGTPSTTEKSFYGGSIPFIRSAEIDKHNTELFLTDEGLKNSSAKMVSRGDLLVALYGANSGDVALSKLDGAINQAILCLKSESSNAFTYQFLSLKKDWVVSTFIQGGQGNLSGDIVKSIKLSFPKIEEQQKIAACLSSLDDLISAQSEKIEALKQHKKGLMQQLFPHSPPLEGWQAQPDGVVSSVAQQPNGLLEQDSH